VEWYDELLHLTGSPVVRLNRAVAVGEADGPQAGDLEQAAELYAEASRAATSAPERDHLTARQRG
jgi:predicted RNA polymerase sigma factor